MRLTILDEGCFMLPGATILERHVCVRLLLVKQDQ